MANKHNQSNKMTQSREEAQRKSNDKYVNGDISVEQWREEFDELSNTRIWEQKGKVNGSDSKIGV